MRLLYPSNWSGVERDIAASAQVLRADGEQFVNINPPASVCPGDVVTQKLAVMNNGEVDLAFDFQLVLSESPDLDEMHEFQPGFGDTIAATNVLGGWLGAELFAIDSVTFAIPSSVEIGTDYYMYLVLDPRDSIAENTESNNVIRYDRTMEVDEHCDEPPGGTTVGDAFN